MHQRRRMLADARQDIDKVVEGLDVMHEKKWARARIVWLAQRADSETSEIYINETVREKSELELNLPWGAP